MHFEPLRIYTAGNVDDGKSTLIGNLMLSTKSITRDKWAEVLTLSAAKNLSQPDLSLLTDGLIEERQKGITIDVAHIYFSTPNRKFILADTPGHKEFTRNMITGASFSDIAIIMIDAQNGIQEQTLRHAYLTGLLRLSTIIFCVNKMDIVGYDEAVFTQIQAEFLPYLSFFPHEELHWIPVSALYGENIAKKSEKMSWYKGDSLLQILENIAPPERESNFRFQVQNAIEEDTNLLYLGIITSGEIAVGDAVMLFPSVQETKIRALYQYGNPLLFARQGMSVALTTESKTVLKRGDLIAEIPNYLVPRKTLSATLCWLEDESWEHGKTYFFQYGSASTTAIIETITDEIDILHFTRKPAKNAIHRNDIVSVMIRTEEDIFLENYAISKANGTFILIDKDHFQTVAVGFVGD